MKLSGGQQIELAALIRNGVKIPKEVNGEEVIVPIEEYCNLPLIRIELAAAGEDIDPDSHRILDETLVLLWKRNS